MISQELSEFSLHARAILDLPIPKIIDSKPSASLVIKGEGSSENIVYEGIDDALLEENTQIRLFGKPNIQGKRRLGVLLSSDVDSESALKKVRNNSKKIKLKFF